MLGEMAERRNAIHDTTLPAIVTARHPHRLVKALTIGPVFQENFWDEKKGIESSKGEK